MVFPHFLIYNNISCRIGFRRIKAALCHIDAFPASYKMCIRDRVYTLNWIGNFNNVFKTRWSASVMNEAKDHNMYYYAVGNELNLGKWNAFVDFMYSKEEIDRKGIITGIVGRPGGHNAFDTGYLSVVAKCNYRFLPKWNAFVKGMYETASVTKASEGIEKGNYRTSWGRCV